MQAIIYCNSTINISTDFSYISFKISFHFFPKSIDTGNTVDCLLTLKSNETISFVLFEFQARWDNPL